MNRESIIAALEPAGRDGRTQKQLADTLGVSYGDVHMALRELTECVPPVVRAVWEDEWDDCSEEMRPMLFYYLSKYTVQVKGEPVILPTTQRHDCPDCRCHLSSDTVAGRRAELAQRQRMARIQAGILRTLLRKGPLSVSGIAQHGFSSRDRRHVAPALDALAEVGKVFEVTPGVFETAP